MSNFHDPSCTYNKDIKWGYREIQTCKICHCLTASATEGMHHSVCVRGGSLKEEHSQDSRLAVATENQRVQDDNLLQDGTQHKVKDRAYKHAFFDLAIPDSWIQYKDSQLLGRPAKHNLQFLDFKQLLAEKMISQAQTDLRYRWDDDCYSTENGVTPANASRYGAIHLTEMTDDRNSWGRRAKNNHFTTSHSWLGLSKYCQSNKYTFWDIRDEIDLNDKTTTTEWQNSTIWQVPLYCVLLCIS